MQDSPGEKTLIQWAVKRAAEIPDEKIEQIARAMAEADGFIWQAWGENGRTDFCPMPQEDLEKYRDYFRAQARSAMALIKLGRIWTTDQIFHQ